MPRSATWLILSLVAVVIGIASFGWSLWAAQANLLAFVAPAFALFWQVTFLGGPILILLGACGLGLTVWHHRKGLNSTETLP